MKNLRRLMLTAALALVPVGMLTLPAAPAQAQIGISITIAPPVLPVYEQPICPEPNYIWTPGYWAYGPGGYYWVPGTWVMAPSPGLLWTPGYWGWGNNAYLWHAGYWGPTVGFYGGVNYGFGYPGTGFYGGRWNGGYFSYNTAYMRVNTTIIRNTYVDRSGFRQGGSRVSFNGGRGGIQMRPNAMQMRAEQQRRFGPTGAQSNQERFARDNKSNWASQNHGRPGVAALQRPANSAADFGHGNAGANRPGNAGRPGNTARPGNTTRPGNESRPGNNVRPGGGNTARPGNERPGNNVRPAPGGGAAQRPGNGGGARPETRPATRPAPSTGRPAQSRPAQQSRPQQQARPAQQARPQQQARPAQQARPQEQGRPQGGDKRPQ